MSEPTLRELLAWLLGITRPVHAPLYASAALRIVNLSLDVVLFGLAAGGVIAAVTGASAPLPILLALVLCALAKATAYYLEQFSGHYVAFKALELLRTDAFSALWPKAPAIVARSRSGDLLASLTRDIDRIEVVYAHTFAPVVSAFVVPTGVLIVTGMTVGWRVTLIPAICLALALLVVPLLGIRSSARHTSQTLAIRRDLAHHLTDSVFGVEEILGYGRQQQRLEQTDGFGDRVAASARVPRLWAAVRRGSLVVLTLASACWIAYVGIESDMPVVVTAALLGGTLRLFEGPRGVEDAVAYLGHSLAAARRLWDISHAPDVVHDGPLELAGDTSPAVTFEEVSFSYGDGAFALQGVSFHAPSGSHVVLAGPSGSGKSTAAHLLLRYFDPESGRIMLDGRPVSDFTLDSLRRSVVAVSQRNQLLDTTILENLRLGAPQATENEAWAALAVVNLADEIAAMPDGLRTQVGVSGRALSGGQAQRLCLARAVLMRPRVLVLDEFTANLNVELERGIRRRLGEALPGVTIIEVTHRVESTADADQIIVLDRGRVVG